MAHSGTSSKRVKPEIQQQVSGQGVERPSADPGKKEKQEIKDEIFDACMGNKWTKVKQLYVNYEFLHKSKLTKSEDTALHLTISSYHPPDRDEPSKDTHLTCIKGMIAHLAHMPEEDRLSILKQKNKKGNTPLHLAAELGSVPIIKCLVKSKDPLMEETNAKGETPLFITAYHGNLKAFLYLHKCCRNDKGEDSIELCRRKDGDNILHAAISGQHFELAFYIIRYYPLLVNRYNRKANTPLHVLSRMPQVFISGSHLRFIDRIIYYCINIEELDIMAYKAEVKENSYRKHDWNLPENYQTLVEFLELLRKGTMKLRECIKQTCWNQEEQSEVTTGVTNVNQEKTSQGHQSDHQIDPEIPPIQGTTGVTNENQDKKSIAQRNDKWYPDNYTTFIKFLKCPMKIVVLVLGIGLQRVRKLEERKWQHTWAVQIMKLLVDKEERYDIYDNTGEKPEDKDFKRQIEAPPAAPPAVDDIKKEEVPSGKASAGQSYLVNFKFERTKETPLLVASKMGILEMVKRILKKYPIAIQDKDSDEKNALLLAAEHRQTYVYQWLIGKKYPPYVYSHEDKHGNNALHLAAKYQNLEVWRIPGSALQLQGERKWYKYVKNTLPRNPHGVPYNDKGQTPRQIFRETHENLLKNGTEWLVKTANSCSVVAALIATVAFATAAAIPGGPDDKGHPHLENQPAFHVFSISSLVSLCFSVTSLVFFLAILTSRCQHKDFEKDLPTKLHVGLTSLFASITAILVTFCASHFFILEGKFKNVTFLIYGATCIPVVFFAFNQFPLYVDLIRSYQKLPLRGYTDSSVASSSDLSCLDSPKVLPHLCRILQKYSAFKGSDTFAESEEYRLRSEERRLRKGAYRKDD